MLDARFTGAARRENRVKAATSGCRTLAAATAVVGIYGQFVDSRAMTLVPRCHVQSIFGALLLVTITAYCQCQRRQTGNRKLPPGEFNRALSRCVYAGLYGLAGVRELVTLANNRLMGLEFPAGMESLQIYVAYGIAALALIRLQIR